MKLRYALVVLLCVASLAANWMGYPFMIHGSLVVIAVIVMMWRVIVSRFNQLAFKVLIDQPDPDKLETADDVEMWLMEKAYTIEHQCKPRDDRIHIIARKNVWFLPGAEAVHEFVIPEEEDEK